MFLKRKGQGEVVGHVDRKPRLGKDTFDGIVDIRVGPTKKLFTIHKQLLCDVSPYFEAAFKGSPKEAIEQRMTFPEDDVNAFKQLQAWLYFRTPLPNHDIMDTSSKGERLQVLVHLYILGDKFQIPALQNAAIDGFIENEHETMHIQAFPFIYQQTSTGSKLRKVCVDLFVWGAHVDDDDTWFDRDAFAHYPQEFLFDVAEAFCRLIRGKDEKIRDFRAIRSRYHI